MAKLLAPEVRAQFAKRLKELRVQSGYLRARYFARSLGIEENRYTRYERAEVEPSLTLLHKMCDVLRVSPNELMGFAGFGGAAGIPAFAEESPDGTISGDRTERHLALLAWRLATETVANRSKQRAQSKGPADPLAAARETGKLFQRLQSDPFGTVSAIVAEDDLKKLDARRKAEFAEVIAAFTEVAAQAAAGTAHR